MLFQNFYQRLARIFKSKLEICSLYQSVNRLLILQISNPFICFYASDNKNAFGHNSYSLLHTSTSLCTISFIIMLNQTLAEIQHHSCLQYYKGCTLLLQVRNFALFLDEWQRIQVFNHT